MTADQEEPAAGPHRPLPAFPALDEVRAWRDELAEAHRRGEVSRDELVELLGQIRRTTWDTDTALMEARDTVLLLATELPAERGGAALRPLARAFNKNGKEEQINGPRQVLVPLRQKYRSAAEYLAAHPRQAPPDTEQ